MESKLARRLWLLHYDSCLISLVFSIPCTVISFVSTGAKFIICPIVNLKCPLGTHECAYFSFTSVLFRPATLQMPNLALIETKRSTVFLTTWEPLPLLHCKKCTVMSDNLGLQDFFLVTNWTRGLSNKALYRNKHKNVNNLMFSLQVEWQRRNNKHINTAWKNL